MGFGPWRVVVECDGNSYEDALENVRALLKEANEDTFGHDPVFIAGEYPRAST